MKRIGKFLRTTLWLGVIVALVVVGLQAFHPFMNNFNGQVQAQIPDLRGAEHVQMQVFAHGNPPHMTAPPVPRFEQPRVVIHQGMHFEKRHDHGFSFGELLIGLLLLVAGWKLWKRGGRARWIGALLLAVVLLPLIGAVLSILIPVAVIYLIWRIIRRKKRRDSMAFVGPEPDFTVGTVDFLDEWEAKTRRELKNKEEQ